MIERWLPRAHFSHAKHETVASCRECHVAAQASRLTSDVLIPTKESCVRCHKPDRSREERERMHGLSHLSFARPNHRVADGVECFV